MMASEMRAAIQKVPMGYRFHPTDDELLNYYLRRKNLGLEEVECVIPDVDICRWEPQELPGKFTESSIVEPKDLEWWFFCEQEPGPTAPRSTGGGHWKKTGETRELRSRNTKQMIGSKKILTFFQGTSSNKTKTDWVMHEFHLPSNALDGLSLPINRKNYVLCMIKCNSDEKANSTPSSHEYEYGRHEPMTIDTDGILELEPDDGSIPEDSVLAKMQSLEPLCRTSTNSPPEMVVFQGGVSTQGTSTNSPREMVEFQMDVSSSADSTPTPFSFERDSIELDSQLSSSEDSDVTDFLNQALIDQDDHFHGFETQTDVSQSGVIQDLDNNMFETLTPHEQHAVIMENKQTEKVESLHGYVPIDEKKGIVEDDFPKPTASSLRVKSPEVKSKKETPKITSYKPAEAKAQKHVPTKIKEEMLSACSSLTSINKPREAAIQVEGRTNAASSTTTKKKEINSIVALNEHEQAAQELKLVATRVKPMSSSSTNFGRKCCYSDPPAMYTCRKCCDSNPSTMYILILLGFIVTLMLIAIFSKIFDSVEYWDIY
ncbi:protein NTM1-like 9 isoform X2 [Punica granatum]|uniref:Protein NTM1-like 9 isoform X2 n=1 Tax=Punica granatum TaxID=22663 RepID=A0A6P8DF28_PUNGR|nr:protein NTM1-like 9 isoform X2 [Punica granatum]